MVPAPDRVPAIIQGHVAAAEPFLDAWDPGAHLHILLEDRNMAACMERTQVSSKRLLDMLLPSLVGLTGPRARQLSPHQE